MLKNNGLLLFRSIFVLLVFLLLGKEISAGISKVTLTRNCTSNSHSFQTGLDSINGNAGEMPSSKFLVGWYFSDLLRDTINKFAFHNKMLSVNAQWWSADGKNGLELLFRKGLKRTQLNDNLVYEIGVRCLFSNGANKIPYIFGGPCFSFGRIQTLNHVYRTHGGLFYPTIVDTSYYSEIIISYTSGFFRFGVGCDFGKCINVTFGTNLGLTTHSLKRKNGSSFNDGFANLLFEADLGIQLKLASIKSKKNSN